MSVDRDADRWRMLPAFLEKYQIDYVALKEDIDAALAQQAPQVRADADLIQRCREIIEWQDSAVLPDGRLRAMAASLEVPSSQRLPVAQAITARQAMEALAANPQQINEKEDRNGHKE